jgi:hypothetical protein
MKAVDVPDCRNVMKAVGVPDCWNIMKADDLLSSF